MHPVQRTASLVSMTLVAVLVGCQSAPPEPPEVQRARGLLDEAWSDDDLAKLQVSLLSERVDTEFGQERLGEAVAAPSSQVRREAARTLESWSPTVAVPLLTTLVGDSNSGVALAAAGALASFGDTGGQAILEGARTAPDGRLDVDVCAALAAIGSETCLDDALGALTSDQDEHAAAAAGALAAIGGDRAASALRSAVKELRGDRRSPAIEALGEVGDPARDVALVLEYAGFRENVLAVIDALGSLGGNRAVKRLERFTRVKDPAVNAEAAGALLRIDPAHAGALETLTRVAGSDRADARYVAARVLGDVDPVPEVVGALASMATDADERVRWEALGGLPREPAADLLAPLQQAWEASSEANQGMGYFAAMEALLLLSRVDGDATYGLLTETLESPNWGHSLQAALGVLERFEQQPPAEA